MSARERTGAGGWLLAAGGLACVSVLPLSLLPGALILTVAPIRSALTGRGRIAVLGLVLIAALAFRSAPVCEQARSCASGYCTALTIDGID